MLFTLRHSTADRRRDARRHARLRAARRTAAGEGRLDAIYRIKEEGFQRSQVMNIMSWLTDVYGPRLTNAPGFRKAGEWAVKEMTAWGLANVKLEPWGPFGKGWTNDKFYAMATTPGGSFPLIGMSTAWTPGTNGLVSGEAVYAVIETPEDMAQFKGQLRGKFVLTSAMRDVPALWTSPGHPSTPISSSPTLERESDTHAARSSAAAAPAAPGRQGGPAAGAAAAPELRGAAHAVLQGRRCRSR